jgi:polyhydroxybutyrate depolymerase
MQLFSFIQSRVSFATLCAAGMCLVNVDALACGRDTDCRIGERVYRVVLPPAATSQAPRHAVIFVHGYMGTAKNILRNKDLVAVATKHGAAFVAAQAVGIEWNVPGVPSVDATPGVDELMYFDRVAADLKQRFGIRRQNIIVAGFSSGAMMVWHLACHRGGAFAGFVAFSGTFWKPLPKSCPLHSINLMHYHGKSDSIVPIHGRQIKDGYQGDVYEAINLIARSGKFGPAKSQNYAGLDCQRRGNASGNVLELCLFAGGHELRPGYLDRAWRKLMPKRK